MANKDTLRALQQRLADRLQQARQQEPARNWLAVRVAGHGFLLPLDQAGEIFPVPPLQAVPHARPWFLGVANLRGQLHGVADLAGFLGLPGREAGWLLGAVGARVVALNQRLQVNTCVLIDQLMGLRHAEALRPMAPVGDAPHFVSRTWLDAEGAPWYELDLAALVSDEAFLKIDV